MAPLTIETWIIGCAMRQSCGNSSVRWMVIEVSCPASVASAASLSSKSGARSKGGRSSTSLDPPRRRYAGRPPTACKPAALMAASVAPIPDFKLASFGLPTLAPEAARSAGADDGRGRSARRSAPRGPATSPRAPTARLRPVSTASGRRPIRCRNVPENVWPCCSAPSVSSIVSSSSALAAAAAAAARRSARALAPAEAFLASSPSAAASATPSSGPSADRREAARLARARSRADDFFGGLAASSVSSTSAASAIGSSVTPRRRALRAVPAGDEASAVTLVGDGDSSTAAASARAPRPRRERPLTDTFASSLSRAAAASVAVAAAAAAAAAAARRERAVPLSTSSAAAGTLAASAAEAMVSLVASARARRERAREALARSAAAGSAGADVSDASAVSWRCVLRRERAASTMASLIATVRSWNSACPRRRFFVIRHGDRCAHTQMNLHCRFHRTRRRNLDETDEHLDDRR